MSAKKFWEYKSLETLTLTEWESLCDGCGKCCLHKLEDGETGEVLYTSVACRFLDIHQCRCTAYAHREQQAADCMLLTPRIVAECRWLPTTCAYRRLLEGSPLPWWHPLISGNPETVHSAGISLRDKAVSESCVDVDDLEPYILLGSMESDDIRLGTGASD